MTTAQSALIRTFFALLVLAVAAPALAASESLLITGFEPFHQEWHNRSGQIAKELGRLLKQNRPDLEVKVCILPVDYDRAAQEALKCFKSMTTPPTRVLSLGEKETPDLNLETQAHNLDDTNYPDNLGIIRLKHPILANWPASLSMRGFQAQEMQRRLPGNLQSRVVISTDMQAYVCNNTAFLLLANLPRTVAFQFIHVPDSHSRNNDYRENAQIILQML